MKTINAYKYAAVLDFLEETIGCDWMAEILDRVAYKLSYYALQDDERQNDLSKEDAMDVHYLRALRNRLLLVDDPKRKIDV